MDQGEFEYDRHRKIKVGEHGVTFNFFTKDGGNEDKLYVFFMKKRNSTLIRYLQVNSHNELELSAYEPRRSFNKKNRKRIFVYTRNYHFHHSKYFLQHFGSRNWVTFNTENRFVVLTSQTEFAAEVQLEIIRSSAGLS